MKIAIIGSGIAGLGAAWLLSRAHDVTVYEKNDYVGGHSNTVEVPVGGGESIPVDTGFIVYNERTYPNLIGLLDTLGVARIKADMSFGVSVSRGGRAGSLEYGGADLKSLFAQKRNLLSPRFLRMIRDILRFYKAAPDLLVSGTCGELSLGALLARDGYSRPFIDDHLLPMAAAIWSCPVSRMADFPAESFIRFFDNHGLLQVEDRPQWWTVRGGCQRYVRRIRDDLERDVATGRSAVAVRRSGVGAIIRDSQGIDEVYDHVVFACHGDEVHDLLHDRSAAETAILSRFTYQRNRAILHGDIRQMPVRRKVWSSWNYLSEAASDRAAGQVSITYWMNHLQSLDPTHPLFVTLNPIREVDPARIYRSFDYDHPVFDRAALVSQAQLPTIQGRGGVWYCGSYCGYGFHEDALGSAVAVARALGVAAPWGHQPVHAMAAVGTGSMRSAVPSIFTDLSGEAAA